jgi:RND family efflux transporter MFP subunit
VDVSAPVSTRLVALKVEEGEVVKTGQVLAQLYSHLEELEMQRAKALMERREFEAKGAKKLYDSKIIPEAKAVETRIDLELARLQFETASEQVRLRTLVSPIDGVVVRRNREVGESVSAGEPLFRILDLSQVLVLCLVEPGRLTGLVPGVVAKVRLEPSGAEYKGTVVMVDPVADANGLVRVKVQVDNPNGRLKAGLKVWVHLADGAA